MCLLAYICYANCVQAVTVSFSSKCHIELQVSHNRDPDINHYGTIISPLGTYCNYCYEDYFGTTLIGMYVDITSRNIRSVCYSIINSIWVNLLSFEIYHPDPTQRRCLSTIRISIIKMRRSCVRLIFIAGFPILIRLPSYLTGPLAPISDGPSNILQKTERKGLRQAFVGDMCDGSQHFLVAIKYVFMSIFQRCKLHYISKSYHAIHNCFAGTCATV